MLEAAAFVLRLGAGSQCGSSDADPLCLSSIRTQPMMGRWLPGCFGHLFVGFYSADSQRILELNHHAENAP